MSLRKFSLEQIGEFKAFLSLKWSVSLIVKHFAKDNIVVSQRYLYYLKDKMKNPCEYQQTVAKSSGKVGRPSSLTLKQLKRLDILTQKADPPTQEILSRKFGVSRSSISYNLKRVLNKKIVKKPKNHFMSNPTVEKRYKRSWSLYRRLRFHHY